MNIKHTDLYWGRVYDRGNFEIKMMWNKNIMSQPFISLDAKIAPLKTDSVKRISFYWVKTFDCATMSRHPHTPKLTFPLLPRAQWYLWLASPSPLASLESTGPSVLRLPASSPGSSSRWWRFKRWPISDIIASVCSVNHQDRRPHQTGWGEGMEGWEGIRGRVAESEKTGRSLRIRV